MQTTHKLHCVNADCVEQAGPQALQNAQQLLAACFFSSLYGYRQAHAVIL